MTQCQYASPATPRHSSGKAQPDERQPCSATSRGGRVPRHPQPGADRPGVRRDPLVAARLRPDLVHQRGSADTAQPARLQGRYPQHPRRGHRDDGPACLGRRRGRPGMDARRLLPGDPANPDADRGVGPRPDGRPGERVRSAEGQWRATHRRHRDRDPGPGPPWARRPADDPGARPHPVGEPGDQRRGADPPARLLLHRRHAGQRGAGRRAVLHRLPAGPPPAVRAAAAQARVDGRVERIHQPRQQRIVRVPARRS